MDSGFINLKFKDVPEGTVLQTGTTVIIEFPSEDDAKKAFDILVSLLHNKGENNE